MSEHARDFSDRWWLVTLGFIGLALLGARLDWPQLPRFLDSYYHLAVIQGFRQAGGLPLHDFWEFAPDGHPHLYPPLFHLLWAPVARVVGDPLTTGRLWSIVGMPALLLVAAWVIGALAGARRATFTTAAVFLPSGLYLSTLIHPTATAALLGILGVWLLFEQRRPVAAGLVLGLIGYLHLGMPWTAISALLLLAVLQRRAQAWPILLVGLLAMAPWWLHIARHAAALQWHAQPESNTVEFSPVLLVLAAAGGLVAIRRETSFRFPLALLAAAVPWVGLYRYRVISAQGLLPLALLAGLALDEGYHRWATSGPRKALFGIALGLLLVVSPTVSYTAPSAWRIRWADTGLILSLRGVPPNRGHAESLYREEHFQPLVKTLRRAAAPDDLFFCNYRYMGGLLSVLTGLSTTTGMVSEMRGQPWDAAIRHARWIVWFKAPAELQAQNEQAGRDAAARHWRLRMESPMAWIYETSEAAGRRQIQGVVIPWGAAYAGLAGYAVLLGWALVTKR